MNITSVVKTLGSKKVINILKSYIKKRLKRVDTLDILIKIAIILVILFFTAAVLFFILLIYTLLK
jgi:hypothetical protein